MKLRTSFFNGGVFRKDITRFAPAWVLYLIGGLLILLSSLISEDSDAAANALAQTMGPFAVINFCYALLNAQLLFGDLFNSRLCNAQHAMPLRRECWFITHVVAGIFFSFVPNFIGVLCLLPTLQEFWFVGAYWLLAMTMHYVFFFGVAVFSALCTGSRFAMAAVYALVNFLSMLAAWLVTTIYQPLLFGIRVSMEPFMLWCPVVQLCMTMFLEFDRVPWMPSLDVERDEYYFAGIVQGGWEYLAIVTAVGVVFLIVALLLYRRRALESAGDFIAVRFMAPVFSVVYTLAMAAVFQMLGKMVGFEELFFFVGLAIGYFTAQMLLQRTVKVIRWKTIGKFALLTVLLIASMVAVWLDPLGITRTTPDKEDVQWVDLDSPYSYTSVSQKFSTPEEIDQMIALHQQILRENRIVSDSDIFYSSDAVTVYLTYNMKNGTQIDRYYHVDVGGEAWELLRPILSKPEEVMNYTDWEEFLRSKPKVQLNDGTELEYEDCQALLSAIKSDCEEGNMAGHSSYHENMNMTYISIIVNNYWTSVRVYEDAEHTVAWLKTFAPEALWDKKY